MLYVRNVSSDKGVFDITRKEITIPLVAIVGNFYWKKNPKTGELDMK